MRFVDANAVRTMAQFRLCMDCIGEPFLRREVERIGERGKCHYCENDGVTASNSEVADYIDTAFDQHYRRTPVEPDAFEYSMIKEGFINWEREGEPAIWAISTAALIDENVAEDLRRVLEERHFDMESAKAGEECPFDENIHYIEQDADDVEYRVNWHYFEEILKTESRFFSETVMDTLENVFKELTAHRTRGGNSVILEAGPETDICSLYRARVFQSDSELNEALKRPDIHMGPPPVALATAGRLNAHGISVFYGATKPSVAVGEVRPPVGSRVIVGEFSLLRKLRLLDVGALQASFIVGSIFDSMYIGQLERAKFLERLSEQIARPIMPDDEPLEYLVTQVIADCLNNWQDPTLDGILYPSVQDGTSSSDNSTNVMLFHKSSRVALSDIPEATEINIRSGYLTEDGWEIDYTVWEETPPPKLKKDNKFDARWRHQDASELMTNVDCHNLTLQLNMENLEVHYINAARYDVVTHCVTRFRSEK